MNVLKLRDIDFGGVVYNLVEALCSTEASGTSANDKNIDISKKHTVSQNCLNIGSEETVRFSERIRSLGDFR
jgi:hypothetical protein